MERHVLAFERYAAHAIPKPVAKLSKKSRLQRVRWANRLLSAVFQTDLSLHTQQIFEILMSRSIGFYKWK